MTTKVARLASEIVSMDECEQEALWQQVAVESYRRGLRELSNAYRQRLQDQGNLDRSIEDLLAELSRKRDDTARNDYSG